MLYRHVILMMFSDYFVGNNSASVIQISVQSVTSRFMCIVYTEEKSNVYRFLITYEPHHEKTNNLHMRNQRRRSVTAKLISAFVLATRIVQPLFYLCPKFQASSIHLSLRSSVCVGPFRKPYCLFSHDAAQL